MTPLRQRYLEDLQLRNYSVKTQQVYVECVSLFARHFARSPEQLGPDQIRAYQLYLIQEKQVSWSRFNQMVCALAISLRHHPAEGLDHQAPAFPPQGNPPPRHPQPRPGLHPA